MTDSGGAGQGVPDWAESWARGHCGCGAQLVHVPCYCGGHIACSASAISIDQGCPLDDNRKEQ